MSEKKKFVPNELSGSLFKNDFKTKDSQPSMTGSCMIDGVEYKISAWTKTTASGKPYFSLGFRNADDQYPLGTGNPDAKPAPPLDDEIPF